MTEKSHSPYRTPVTCGLALLILIAGVFTLHHTYQRYMQSLYPTHHAELVLAASREHGVEPSLVYAVIHSESHFDESALSHARAKGLMQLTDGTFRWAVNRAGKSEDYTIQDIYEPSVNIHVGVYVLSLFREQFDDTETVLAAYNAGQGRVKEWLADPACSADGVHLDTIPYTETAQYVQRVLQAQKRYQRLYGIS